MKTVITYGTFDLLHYGHILLLQRAKKYGDRVIVGLSTNKFNALKNKKTFLSYATRKKLLLDLKMVDFVFPEKNWEQKIKDVKKYKADVFVMGSDWKGKFDFLKPYCKVVYLPRTPEISSTQMRSILNKRVKKSHD